MNWEMMMSEDEEFTYCGTMLVAERDFWKQRSDSQQVEIKRMREMLGECAAALDHISRRGGFSETLGWGDIIKLRDKARAAGGDDA